MTKSLSLIVVLLAAWVIHRAICRLTHQQGLRKLVPTKRVRYVMRCLQLFNAFATLIVATLIIGIDYAELSLFLSSVFAVIGVALFAQWSILSNLTASLLIFFAFPYRVGDQIKVLDKDDDISGEIEEIGPFHIHIRASSGDLITYPNSLLLQKGVVKLNDNNASARHVDL